MAQLIQIRQRIKAIETIKKITHAMRLIAMSSHTRLKGLQKPLKNYQQALASLFNTVKLAHPQWYNPLFKPAQDTGKTLIILIGSQKGLCGNFNSSLFYSFDDELPQLLKKNPVFIAVGKKAIDHLIQKKGITPLIQYKNMNAGTIAGMARAIINLISNTQPYYESVIVFSNHLKTFFIQKPETMVLIPFTMSETMPLASPEEYQWEQPAEEILNDLAQQLLVAHLEYLLFESLLAEQAARFISMDSSTRNANNLLDETKLTYNKLRQANITKELSELTGSF